MNEAKSVRSRRVGSGEGRLRCCAACPWNPPRPAPRALHPLPRRANAAHAEYSDRLQAQLPQQMRQILRHGFHAGIDTDPAAA